VIFFYVIGSSAFTAVRVTVIAGTNNIRFPDVLLNTGNDYDNSTGVFTCRIPGHYWFSASIAKPDITDIDYVVCWIQINGVDTLYLYSDPHGDNRDGVKITASAAFHLSVRDTVQVGHCSNADSIWYAESTHFSGILIKPDM